MATAPAPVKHEPPKHEPAKVVGQEGALVLPLADAAGGEPLIGARGVKGEHIEDGERDPDTIAEEQRRRSDEYVMAMANDARATRANDPAPRLANHLSPKK